METDFGAFHVLLTLIWFLIYWILGGVLFALVTILRLGRVRKVRFSCLFTLLALVVATGSVYFGMRYAKDAQEQCLALAQEKAEVIVALFGCGAVGVFGAFLLGAAVLVLGGFLILRISRSKNKPWIRFDGEDASPAFLDPDMHPGCKFLQTAPGETEGVEGSSTEG